MKKYRVTAEEILYVGDEHRDIEACQKTGVKMAAVTWGFDPLSLLQRGGPDYIADRPEDIITAVKSMREEMASVPMS
jgi:phosphoglycolate phosphatase